MYSYEDRIRAVKLYVKLGKRAAPTIRKLGYPTKNSLKGWYREYEQSLDLQVGYVRSLKYSDEQKRVAVQHYLDHDRCIASTMKALGYPLAHAVPLNTARALELRHKPVQVLRRTPIGSGFSAIQHRLLSIHFRDKIGPKCAFSRH